MATPKTLSGQRFQRPQAKCVDVKHIRDWLPEEAPRSIDITSAWTIIKNHYCGALVGRGVCPITCSNCRDAIVSMFDLQHAKNPEALLTWRAKDLSAAMIEELIEAQKNERPVIFPALETELDPLATLFPHKRSENPFLEMEEDYL